MDQMSLLSPIFEQALLDHIGSLFEATKRTAEKEAITPRYIRKSNIKKYVDVSTGTLAEWEKRGLKRIEPIEDGAVFYDTKEIDRFMVEGSY